MKVAFNTYPWAFCCPGGGEQQIVYYRDFLPGAGVEVIPHDIWAPRLAEVDAVHFFSVMGGSSAFCGYVKAMGKPLVVSSSLWVTPETTGLYPIDEIRHQLSLANVIVPNSHREADALSSVLGLPRERFMPVYNGVDPLFAEPVPGALFRERFGIEGDFILNVGNIEPRKNQLGLVRAAQGLDLPVILVGHVREQAYFDQVMEEAQGRARYVGALAHEDPALRSAYAACSVFVLPSTLETPGLAALEAAATGARLVVTAEGSTEEYFGDMVHYVDHTAPDDIRAKIQAALAAPVAPALREQVLTRFLWPQVVKELRAVYAAAIGGTP
ncbi:MAG: glycosyltransferase [Acetobacter papayae]|uniref:glycosyltransferase n=1 Tax=Acetobacter papayae TaxID=1076592 RepID=UPI0039E8524C